MRTAIVLTLFFAAATSALGALNNLRFGARKRPRELFGAVLGGAMAGWFGFAGVWLLMNP